jgi:hypothetical protein
MERTVERDSDGNYTLIIDGQVIATGTDPEVLYAQTAAFYVTELVMPDEVPMHKIRQFMIVTNRKSQIENFLNSLPEPQKSLAKEDYEYAPNFVPNSPIGRAVQAALGLSDADFAEAVCAADSAVMEDYGNPKPSFWATITKFFIGG